MTGFVSARTLIRAALLASALGAAVPAAAQLTTATIRGTVAAPATGGTTVTAVNVETGFRVTAQAGPDGTYVLSGLRPGTYDISAPGAASQRVVVSVGQTATLDLDAPAAAQAPRARPVPKGSRSSSPAPASPRPGPRRSRPTSPASRSRICRRTTATS